MEKCHESKTGYARMLRTKSETPNPSNGLAHQKGQKGAENRDEIFAGQGKGGSEKVDSSITREPGEVFGKRLKAFGVPASALIRPLQQLRAGYIVTAEEFGPEEPFRQEARRRMKAKGCSQAPQPEAGRRGEGQAKGESEAK